MGAYLDVEKRKKGDVSLNAWAVDTRSASEVEMATLMVVCGVQLRMMSTLTIEDL
jgi:hypothetical protein